MGKGWGVRRMVAYGHSWIDGAGASSSESGFAAQAAVQLGLGLDNRGVGGSSSTGTAELVAVDPPPLAALYLLMTGLNDLRLGGESPSAARHYAAALQSVLAAFTRASPNAVVVAVGQPYLIDFSLHAPHNRGSNTLIDRYNSALARAAAGCPRIAVAEAEDWDADRMLHADTVHPNDVGHVCLARAVTHAVTRSGHP